MAATDPSSTLGMRLERRRLEHRLLRAIGVVSALRRRVEEHEHDLGPAPHQLHGPIADFEAEIATMHERLHALRGQLTSAADAAGPDALRLISGGTPDPWSMR